MSNTVDQTQLDWTYEQIEAGCRGGDSVEAVVARMLRNPFGAPPQEVVDAAVDKFHSNARMIINYDTVESIQRKEHSTGTWYSGPDFPGAVYWPAVKKKIEAKIGSAVDEVDKASSQVIASMRSSADPEIDTRGLVLGYVQSGKTTNFLSVIAKAADIGYRFFIILTGITENLRAQTQIRLEEQLTAETPHWYTLTGTEYDFRDPHENSRQNAASLLSSPQNRVLAVVKKNARILQKLNDFITSAGIAGDECPILIIDDEADQASINVSRDPENDPSAINAQIQQLLRNKKAAYIAYTATPFANILVNPNSADDIYPRDFIHVLPKPEGYFGTETIFGREPLHGEDDVDSDGLDMIREIPDEETDALRPPGKRSAAALEWSPYIPSSLLKAVRWFIMATAARRVRGDSEAHSSMLIHTAMKTDAHRDAYNLMKPALQKMQRGFDDGTSRSTWEEQWITETEAVDSTQFGISQLSFEEIETEIPAVFGNLDLIVDNATSEDRLDYDDKKASTVIAIGGNTLSRGLTLEGLICSYFVRNASAYDTLLQMGRWFGFRKGYEDLPRIWMTEELEYWFRELALVEADLRQDFSRYARDGINPLDFQARIRVNPGMEVTSRAKQQFTRKANVSYSGQKVQTILFNHKNRQWLSHNIEATKDLVKSLKIHQTPQLETTNGTVVYRRVSNDMILDFLNNYRIHEESNLGKDGARKLIEYIEKERDERSIREWSVSFYGKNPQKEDPADKQIDLGLDQKLNLISRSQMNNSKPGIANIKTLVGSLDRINDAVLNRAQLKMLEEKISNDSRTRDAVIVEAHSHYVGSDVAHLAIYAIDKNSETEQRSDYVRADGTRVHPRNRRKNLEAEEHVIGIGIFFPESRNPAGSVEYVCVIEPDEETLERYAAAAEEIASTNQKAEA